MSMREALATTTSRRCMLATSAMRDAKNGSEFVSEAKRLADLDIQVIGGAHEARRSKKALAQPPEMPEETCLTMDIGGGSVELWFEGLEIQWAQSFNTGVARLHMLMGLPIRWDGKDRPR